MSNSEPNAIVLHGIPCIGGLYIGFDSTGENGSVKIRRDCTSDGKKERTGNVSCAQGGV